MSTKKEERKKYAKDLYTEFDSEGKRKYSFQEIVDKVNEKFTLRLTRQAVFKWKKEDAFTGNDWDLLNQKIKQHAVNKSQDEKFSAEEKIVDARSDDLAEVYRYGKQMAQIGTKVFQDYYNNSAHKHISVKEALAAARIGVNIMLRLNDIPDAEETDFGMIYIPDNGR